jgi:hypothetical protein
MVRSCPSRPDSVADGPAGLDESLAIIETQLGELTGLQGIADFPISHLEWVRLQDLLEGLPS